MLPYLSLGTGILVLSLSGLFIRWSGAPGPVVGLYRFGIAALILAPWVLRNLTGKTDSSEGLSPKVLLIPVAGGLFSALDYGLWSLALDYTTIGNATMLSFTAPLWVGLAAFFLFRERLKPLFWIGLLLTFLGISVVIGGDILLHYTFAYGDILGLASGIFFAGYFLVTQVGRQQLNTLTYFWILNISSAVALFVICLVLQFPIGGYSIQTYLIFVAGAVFFQFLGYYMIVYALGHLTASIVSPTMMIMPVIAAILAFSLLDEKMAPAQIAGGLIVLIGIYFVHVGKKRSME